MKKASGGDRIPAELFQILKDDVKVQHSIRQQIWKTQQWSQNKKRSGFIPIPKQGSAKELPYDPAIPLLGIYLRKIKTLIQKDIRTLMFRAGASQVVLVVKNPPANAGDIKDEGSTPETGRSLGGGNGNPLQYAGWKNPMDRGAWWATVLRVTKSQTRLKQFSMLACTFTAALFTIAKIWGKLSVHQQMNGQRRCIYFMKCEVLVVPDSFTRFTPVKNTGVGSYFLLQGIFPT